MASGKKLEAIVSVLGNIDPSLEKAVVGATKKLDKMGIKTAAVSAGMAAVTGIAVKKIIDFGKDSVNAAKEFETSMADVAKVVDGLKDSAGKPTKAYGEFEDKLISMSKNIPMAVGELTQITAAAGQSGIASEELMKFTEDAAKMGTAFDIPAETAGEMAAVIRNSLRMSQDDFVSLADKVNYFGNTTTQSASKIMDVVKDTGLIGKSANVSGEQIAALSAAMTGMDSANMSTGLNNIFAGLTKGEGATQKAQEAWAKLGTSSDEVAKQMQIDSEGAMKKNFAAFKNLPAEEMSSQIAAIFGNNKSTKMAIASFVENFDVLDENFAKIKDEKLTGGSMEQEFDAASNTFAAKTLKFQNAIEGFKIKTGEKLLPVLSKLLESSGPAIEQLTPLIGDIFTKVAEGANNVLPKVVSALSWVSKNGETVRKVIKNLGIVWAAVFAGNVIATIMRTAKVFRTLGSAVLRVGKFFTIASLKAKALIIQEKALAIATKAQAIATKIAGVAQKAFNLVMSMNPVGLIITGIMLLVGAFILLWNKSEKFRNFFIGMWEKIKLAFQVVVLMFKIGIIAIKAAFAKIVETVGIVFAAIKTKFTAVVNFFKSIPEKIKGAFASLGGFFKGIFTKIVDLFKGIGTKVGDAIGSAFKFVVNSVLKGVETVLNAPIKALNKALGIINKIPKVNIPLIPTFDLPQLAIGEFTEGVSIAGEAGREAVISFDRKYRKENLSYWAKAGQMLGALPDDRLGLGDDPRGGSSYNMGPIHFAPIINVSGDVTADDIRRKIEEAFEDFYDMFESKLKERDIDGAYIFS
jgi:TP901 family phage tail tape measure protein